MQEKMAEQTVNLFPEELIENGTLSCAICKNILRLPIMLVQHTGNVCSTCFETNKEIKEKIIIHNEALESIFKSLRLPCKNKPEGCQERLEYDKLFFHQNNCTYRTKICAMFNYIGCKWEGNSNEFIKHFKENHTDHVINLENNRVLLQTPLKETDFVKLLAMENSNFVLRMQMNLDKKKLFYIVCNIKDDNLFCEYTVKHKGNDEAYIKTKSKVLPSHHIYECFIENVAVQVDLEALRQISKVSDSINHVFKIKLENLQFLQMEDKMLHFFECPVCKNCMKPPIWQCLSGHSVCSNCRPRLEKCPTCRSPFGNIRNYALESLTSGISYPCVYHDMGCLKRAQSGDIVRHEGKCLFKPYNCPFSDCTYTGNHEVIIKHLRDFHSEGIITSGLPGYTESFRLDQNCSYNKVFDRKCLIAYNHIFRLICKRVSDNCLWAAEVFGSKDDSKAFIYEVVIMDMRVPEKKLIRTDYCLNEMPEDELFKRCILFPNSILSSYTTNGMITFRFTIKEKLIRT